MTDLKTNGAWWQDGEVGTCGFGKVGSQGNRWKSEVGKVGEAGAVEEVGGKVMCKCADGA